jgi:SAM-dependent methyltransferase
MGHVQKCASRDENCTVLDFGCSSGRVLRHFETERRHRGWKLCGVDVQARPIEWMRYHLPDFFEVATCSTMPHLPFADASIDFIYGISVFTHIKYLWDTWLLELKRILKPGGLLMQTIHAEPAWEFYFKNRTEPWVASSLSPEMLAKPRMDVDFFYHGDALVSQVFWKESVARSFWGRYFTVLDVTPPPPRSFQNWIICRKPAA